VADVSTEGGANCSLLLYSDVRLYDTIEYDRRV